MIEPSRESDDLHANGAGGETTVDALLEELLVEYDETLAGGDARTLVIERHVPEALLPQLRGLQRFVAMLHAAARQGVLTRWEGNEVPQAVRRTSLPDVVAGERIGRFELIRELGRGGYGVVFLAYDPDLRREVALKLPRPEALVSPDLRRRFVREAQAAARLEHPHLVPVHEIGDDGGLCYLVSQYCHGPSLAQWLHEHARPVPIRDAAALVADLADALAHAHREGVLHRDIKTGNVLLEPPADRRDATSPSPLMPLSTYQAKLNDFGLAKVAHGGDAETNSGALLGTPCYMSPEQATGRTREIGPATDIYSLGVILYELLTGRAPFVGQSDAETLQQLVSNEPIAPGRMRIGLPRDLEAICLVCLEKRPGNRYGSAEELAEDLGRFLAGRPTKVRPLTPPQRLWKWSQRNPGVATLAATVMILLAALATGSAVAAVGMARLADRERESAQAAVVAKEKAEEATAQAQFERDQTAIEQARAVEAEGQAKLEVESRRQVSRFLVGLLESPDSVGASGFGLRRQSDSNAELTAREMLDRGAERLKNELVDQPLVRAQLLNTIGSVYSNLGDVQQAGPLLDEALTLQREHHAPPLELAETLHNLTWVRHIEARYREGEEFGREALEIRRQALGEGHLLVASTMFNLAWALADKHHRGDQPEAESLFNQSLEIRRKHLPWNHRDIGISLSALAAMRLQRRDMPGAVPFLAQAALVFAQQPGGDKLVRALGLYQQAILLRNRRRYDRSEERYRETIQLLDEFFQGDHPAIAMALGDMAGMLNEAREFDSAEAAVRRAIEMGRRLSPGGHPHLIVAMREYGESQSDIGQHEEALQILADVLAMSRRVFDEDDYEIADSIIRLAFAHHHRGDDERALELARQWRNLILQVHSDNRAAVVNIDLNMAIMLHAHGETAEAEEILRQTVKRSPANEAGYGNRARSTLAMLLNEREPGSAEAEELARQSVEVERAAAGRESHMLARYQRVLGQVLLDQGRLDEAAAELSDALRICRKDLRPGHWLIHDAEVLCGACLAGQRRYDEAEPLLLAGYKGLQVSRGPQHRDTVAARERLCRLVRDAAPAGPMKELAAVLVDGP